MEEISLPNIPKIEIYHTKRENKPDNMDGSISSTSPSPTALVQLPSFLKKGIKDNGSLLQRDSFLDKEEVEMQKNVERFKSIVNPPFSPKFDELLKFVIVHLRESVPESDKHSILFTSKARMKRFFKYFGSKLNKRIFTLLFWFVFGAFFSTDEKMDHILNIQEAKVLEEYFTKFLISIGRKDKQWFLNIYIFVLSKALWFALRRYFKGIRKLPNSSKFFVLLVQFTSELISGFPFRKVYIKEISKKLFKKTYNAPKKEINKIIRRKFTIALIDPKSRSTRRSRISQTRFLNSFGKKERAIYETNFYNIESIDHKTVKNKKNEKDMKKLDKYINSTERLNKRLRNPKDILGTFTAIAGLNTTKSYSRINRMKSNLQHVSLAFGNMVLAERKGSFLQKEKNIKTGHIHHFPKKVNSGFPRTNKKYLTCRKERELLQKLDTLQYQDSMKSNENEFMEYPKYMKKLLNYVHSKDQKSGESGEFVFCGNTTSPLLSLKGKKDLNISKEKNFKEMSYCRTINTNVKNFDHYFQQPKYIENFKKSLKRQQSIFNYLNESAAAIRNSNPNEIN